MLKKIKDEPVNESFMSMKNLQWFHFVVNYEPDQRPLVFLPCGSANKTRGKNGDHRKFISQGLSHQLLSAITRNDSYCKIILSEPLTIIPYEIEGHELRPDYNLPPDYLSIQSEFIFIHNVSLYLAKLKLKQPWRSRIYYVGALHHYLILHFANKLAGDPFFVIREIPSRGLANYSEGALNLIQLIDLAEKGFNIDQEPIDLKKYLKKRGRYTNLRFWHQILLMQKEEESVEVVCSKEQYKTGFESLFKQFEEVMV